MNPGANEAAGRVLARARDAVMPDDRGSDTKPELIRKAWTAEVR
jgi:hypothetical protein